MIDRCEFVIAGVDGLMDHGQVLGLLDEREAACRVRLERLEGEAEQIAGLLAGCRRELERLATAREVVGELVTAPPQAAAAPEPDAQPPGRDTQAEATVDAASQRVLAVLAGRGAPVRCRDVVQALGEDPTVARHVERVRHRLKKLVAVGRVAEPRPGMFTLRGDGGDPIG